MEKQTEKKEEEIINLPVGAGSNICIGDISAASSFRTPEQLASLIITLLQDKDIKKYLNLIKKSRDDREKIKMLRDYID